jgi:predicted ATP-grasp superfamily ATP-dependent carboligase
MNCLTKKAGKMKDIFRFSGQPEFECPSLIVGWDKDAGRLSPKVFEYLNRKMNLRGFCEVEPAGFFSLGGVTIENDVAQFPEGKFYCCESGHLVIFKGSEPRFERYRFLNAISDLAQHCCKIKDLYTIGGTISPTAHTVARKILAVFNQEQFQAELRDYGLKDMTWEGPPAISSYLLWVAKRRGIAGVSLWTPVPFYLAGGEDLQAIKVTLSFLDERFGLGLDLKDVDDGIRRQNAKMAQIRRDDSEVDKSIGALESGLSLSEEEQMELTRKVAEALEEDG